MKLIINPILLYMIAGIISCSKPVLDPMITSSENPYSLGRVGNMQDVQTATTSGLVLMGGSTDVDAAMKWMIERAGRGDFVIIRVSGGTGYNDYLYEMGGLNSVETLRINTPEAANDEKVYQTLKNAEALFIAGGDQSQYIRLWEGSKVEEAIQYLIHEKKIPIGGTSAGCAVMGEFVYTGEKGSVTGAEALADPFDERMTVQRSSLVNHPLLKNSITDQHFSQRERQGRLMGFLARLKEQSDKLPLRAIAVDEKTALVIDENGIASQMGQANVFLFEETFSDQNPEVLQPGMPLSWVLGKQALKVKILGPEQKENLQLNSWDFDWDIFWFVENGILRSN
jgi:cyanophycinase